MDDWLSGNRSSHFLLVLAAGTKDHVALCKDHPHPSGFLVEPLWPKDRYLIPIIQTMTMIQMIRDLASLSCCDH